jgi:hypothetical protein
VHLANIAAHGDFGAVVGVGYGSLGANIGCRGAIGEGGRGENRDGLATGVDLGTVSPGPTGRKGTAVALGTGLVTGVGLGTGRGATCVGRGTGLLGIRYISY